MSIKIISDTSSDITFKEQKEYDIDMVPFSMNVMDESFIDDEKLDFNALRTSLANAPKRAKDGECVLSTSCPPPAAYITAFERNKGKDIIVVSISNILSGAYNSANLAKNMYLQEHPSKDIHLEYYIRRSRTCIDNI